MSGMAWQGAAGHGFFFFEKDTDMELTRAQVATKLGCSTVFIDTLMKNGALTPIEPRKPGTKKFFAKFDSTQLREVSKRIKFGKGGRARLKPLTNGADLDAPVEMVDPPVQPKSRYWRITREQIEASAKRERENPPTLATSFTTRLIRIEDKTEILTEKIDALAAKIDTLLALWQ